MKALRSDLARSVLADPAAKDQLRGYLADRKSPAARSGTEAASVIELRTAAGPTLRLHPRVVPRAD